MSMDHPEQSAITAAQRKASLSRRRFLRGVGACIALPALDSLIPARSALAALPVGAAGPLGTTASGAPLRMAFVYFPNGAIPSAWWPTGEGKDFQFNKTMEPLADLKEHLQVVGGLECQNAYPGPDGPGDHARASGSFLTGVRVKKTAGADIHAGVSVDQLAAQQIGHLTRFPSLELSCDAIRKSGSCDSGYSCAYQYNLAWRSPTTPVAPEANPRLLFERLFGAGSHGERKLSLQRRQAQQRSILDFVMQDAAALNSSLGGRDQQKLDEYFTSIREIELRIDKAEKFADQTPDPNIQTPDGVPADYSDYIKLMADMMVLAFQTDSTRIATFLLANEGSNRTFSEVGFAEGHHFLTHHRNDADMIEKVKVIDNWYVQHLAYLLRKLNEAKDTDGNSLLHNSMIVYGSGNADGNRHTHVNLPIILAGGGGGTLTPGRYINFESKPATNMFLSMVDRLGVHGVERFGDSTGRVEGI